MKKGLIEEPVIKKDESGHYDHIVTHPAFGQVTLTRPQGHANLYGSDFSHMYWICMRVHESVLYRGLSRDWAHATKEIMEVWLSEAQWSSLVSSVGMGGGVQCTLRYVDGKELPYLPNPASRKDQFKKEAKDRLLRAQEKLGDLTKAIDGLAISNKKKHELIGSIGMVQNDIHSNLNFVMEQFGDHMEKTVEKAKAEIDAYMQQKIQASGLDAMSEHMKLLTSKE